MGGNMSGICCDSNSTSRGLETDIILFKKELKETRNNQDESMMKRKKHKDLLDKHMRDHSFKQNSFSNLDKNRIERLYEYSESNTDIMLTLKVLNSNLSQIKKGEEIKINCLGLVSSEFQDGLVYFGCTDGTFKERIDYFFPVPNEDNSMYILFIQRPTLYNRI